MGKAGIRRQQDPYLRPTRPDLGDDPRHFLHRTGRGVPSLARDGCRLRLVYLPAYSPNLNLIERLWWLLKKTAIWHRHYPSFGEFKAAINGFFDGLGACHQQLVLLITGRFRFIGAS
jgi:hypothetical protein